MRCDSRSGAESEGNVARKRTNLIQDGMLAIAQDYSIEAQPGSAGRTE